MKPTGTIAFAAAAVAVGGLGWIFFAHRAPVAPAAPPVLIQPAGPGETVAISLSAEDIFRRAFWRRPTSADRILHADRREWSDATRRVQRWQWYLKIEPSPDLLQALRDPATFGLIRQATLAPAAAGAATAPAWFPTASQLTGCEILRAPAGGLTVCYRAKDNVLFATDAGRGFTPPVTPVVASR